jgi:hypothetical protein
VLQLPQVFGAQVGREEADEFHDVGAQVGAAPIGKARGLRREEMRTVERDQPLVLAGTVCARRDDPDAQSQAHVRLDHVGVERRERDLGRKARARERPGRSPFVPAKVGIVGDDRVLRDRLQGEARPIPASAWPSGTTTQ